MKRARIGLTLAVCFGLVLVACSDSDVSRREAVPSREPAKASGGSRLDCYRHVLNNPAIVSADLPYYNQVPPVEFGTAAAAVQNCRVLHK